MSGVTNNLTENDQRILAMAWHCFQDMPKVDYKKLAKMGGYKTPASATTAYINARKKLMQGSTAPAAKTGKSDGAPTTTLPKPNDKKRPAPVTSADGTGKKRGHKSKAETQAAATIEADADDDETKDDIQAASATEAGAGSIGSNDETTIEVKIKGEGDSQDGTEKVSGQKSGSTDDD